MENSTAFNLSISKIKEYVPATQVIGIGEEFCIVDVKSGDQFRSFEYPCRFDGVLVVYCVKGRVKISVNLNDYDIEENSIFISMPNNILKVCDLASAEGDDMRYVILAMSQKFVTDLKVDFKHIISEGVALVENPVTRLEEDDMKMMSRYLEMMVHVLRSDMEYRDEAVRSLLSSMFCLVASVWKRRVERISNTPLITTRSKMVLEQFIKLVAEYHTSQRNVGFYADKLCLTPKYLSKLIKTASGRSAPEWIDAYVILESKNLLKYSNMAIKEIVYRLNFPNQSVFYKFFKARTGMTPSEYRNS